MERDMSARRIYGEEETPESGAGSEFGKKQREEARRKKFGIVTREFKVEDQPWLLKINGKAGKRCWIKYLMQLCCYVVFDQILINLLSVTNFLGSKVKRRVALQKMLPTTSSHSVPTVLLKPFLSTAGTTSLHWRSTGLSLQKRPKRSGAGERTACAWKENPVPVELDFGLFTGGTRSSTTSASCCKNASGSKIAGRTTRTRQRSRGRRRRRAAAGAATCAFTTWKTTWR